MGGITDFVNNKVGFMHKKLIITDFGHFVIKTFYLDNNIHSKLT